MFLFVTFTGVEFDKNYVYIQKYKNNIFLLIWLSKIEFLWGVY